jgi:thiol-disulfide isomerase/thioredoxin
MADAKRKDYEGALRDLTTYLNRRREEQRSGAAKPDPGTIYAVSEAFLQRLIHAGRFGDARRACTLFAGVADADVRAHFTARLATLELLGKPAPAIEGTDVDGRRVNLASYKGKVVLINFWATWCPPCVAAVPQYNALVARYGKQGFDILGVNVDAVREGAKDLDQVRSAVRRFLLDFKVTWENVFNLPGAGDVARGYAVSDLPETFLVGRDGTILQVELSGPDLEKAIADALARQAGEQRSNAPRP